MLQNFNVPGQTGKPYNLQLEAAKFCTVTAILDGKVIAKRECTVNAFTHMAYKACNLQLEAAKSCYDTIPAEYEPRISDIMLVNQWGDVTKLETWIKHNGY